MNGVCIVGHTRTFHIPAVQRGFKDVLLPAFPGTRVHGILFSDNIARFRFGPILAPPKDGLRFDLVHRIPKSTCSEYRKLTGHKMCKENMDPDCMGACMLRVSSAIRRCTSGGKAR